MFVQDTLANMKFLWKRLDRNDQETNLHCLVGGKNGQEQSGEWFHCLPPLTFIFLQYDHEQTNIIFAISLI